MRTALFLLAFFLLPGLAARAEKVALIVNGGDTNTAAIGHILRERVEQSKQFYEKLGYRVIVQSEQGSSPEAFYAAIGELKNVEDFHLQFLGHGELNDTKEQWDPTRFPSVGVPQSMQAAKITPDKLEAEQLQWRAILGDGSLGINDIRASLFKLQKQSPGVKTTVYTLNCFGGMLPYALADMPHVQAFSSSHETSMAFSLPLPNQPQNTRFKTKTDFPQAFQESLRSGKSISEAMLEAQKVYQDLSLAHPPVPPFTAENLALPRSPMQGFLRNWCEKKSATQAPFADLCENDAQPALPGNMEPILHVVKFQALEQALAPTKLALQYFSKLSTRHCGPDSAEKRKKDSQELRALILQNLSQVAEQAKREIERANAVSVRTMISAMQEQGGEGMPEKMKAEQDAFLAELKGARTPAQLLQLKKKNLQQVSDSFQHCQSLSMGEFGSTFCAPKINSLIEQRSRWAMQHSVPQPLAEEASGRVEAIMEDPRGQEFELGMACLEIAKKHKDWSLGRKAVRACFQKKLQSGEIMLTTAINFLSTVEHSCELLRSSEAAIKEDLSCAKQFQAEGDAAAWSRFLELQVMGNARFHK